MTTDNSASSSSQSMAVKDPLLGYHPPAPPRNLPALHDRSNQQNKSIYSISPSFGRKLASPPSVDSCYASCLTSCGECCGKCRTYCPLCCCCDNPYITIPQGEVGIVSKFGKAYKIIDPGMYFVNQITETVKRVDIKIQMISAPRQVVMTKDNVTLTIDSVLYWHIFDPFVAVYHVENVRMALLERTMTTLRDTIGAHTLQNVIENREALAAEIKRIIEATSASWGVIVESILIKDMSFSEELQKTLAAAAKQKRLGESKVITAKAEVQAAKLMREASDILCTPAAIQIRYLETLSTMAHQPQTKIVFLPKEAENRMEKVVKDLVLSKLT